MKILRKTSSEMGSPFTKKSEAPGLLQRCRYTGGSGTKPPVGGAPDRLFVTLGRVFSPSSTGTQL